jgi:hypothetical protein
VVALESAALSLAKTIVQKAAGAWIADRCAAEESKKELRELLTPWFRRGSPEQQFLDEAASELASVNPATWELGVALPRKSARPASASGPPGPGPWSASSPCSVR